MELNKKIEQSIKLLRSIKRPEVELSYSGGKDSDVILELSRMAGINVRPIYKMTTIDPPGTIRHCREKGVEIMPPKMTFFQLIEKKGFPTRRARFCCDVLKEYKILDCAIQGIRRSESVNRSKLYHEPVICRFYGSKKNNVQVVLPILEWTDDDVEEFISTRGIKCHPLYYENGIFNVKKRLGCLCCPLRSDNGLAEFKRYPNMVKAWIRAGEKYWNTHPGVGIHKIFESIYDLFTQNIFFRSLEDFRIAKDGMFGKTDCKKFLEDYFRIKL